MKRIASFYDSTKISCTQEDFDFQKKRVVRSGIVLLAAMLLFVIYFFQKFCRLWVIPLAVFILMIILWSRLRKVSADMEELVSRDALGRSLLEMFDISSISFPPDFGKWRSSKTAYFIGSDVGAICSSSLESDVLSEESVLPRFRFTGVYKGLEFAFDEYKLTTVKDNRRVFSRPRYFLKLKLREDFRGSVGITTEKKTALKTVLPREIETEDIMFNKTFSVCARNEAEAFRLVNPRTIVTVSDFHNNVLKKGRLDILFSDGCFYTRQDSGRDIKLLWGTKKVRDLKKVKKALSAAESFIKTYIDGLKLDSVKYTTGQ